MIYLRYDIALSCDDIRFAYEGTDIISCLRSKYIIRQRRISYRVSDISLKTTTNYDIILLDKLEFDEEVISMSKKKNKKKSNWTPPKEYKNYFYASSDEEFKAKHPIGYGFLVMLGIAVLLLPAIVFCVLVGTESGWVMLGFAGGFVFGIGLFNFVAIIIKQHLGHWVSIISFLVGGIMMLISWFLCR